MYVCVYVRMVYHVRMPERGGFVHAHASRSVCLIVNECEFTDNRTMPSLASQVLVSLAWWVTRPLCTLFIETQGSGDLGSRAYQQLPCNSLWDPPSLLSSPQSLGFVRRV